MALRPKRPKRAPWLRCSPQKHRATGTKRGSGCAACGYVAWATRVPRSRATGAVRGWNAIRAGRLPVNVLPGAPTLAGGSSRRSLRCLRHEPLRSGCAGATEFVAATLRVRWRRQAAVAEAPRVTIYCLVGRLEIRRVVSLSRIGTAG